MITIADCYAWAKLQVSDSLGQKHAREILCVLLKCDLAGLMLRFNESVDDKFRARYVKAIQKYNSGYPLAYLLGRQAFWTLDFFVNESVLIPRPDTETLVRVALDKLDEKAALKIIDLGTGSGAIACSLASERADWQIFAVDNSLSALSVTSRNVQYHQLSNVSLIASDWAKALVGQFDAIVTNPPYLQIDDEHADVSLEFEPNSALVSGPSGLECIELIIIQAKKLLKSHGLLAIEHGFLQAQAVQQLLLNNGFVEVDTIRDISNHPRVTIGYFG